MSEQPKATGPASYFPSIEKKFSHVMVGANDLEASKKFDDAVLGTLNLAYLRDPIGNKICVLHRPAK